MSKESSSAGVVWARQQPPHGKAKRDVEQPPWHRAEAVNDTAIRTACQRFFATPLEMRPEAPEGDSIVGCASARRRRTGSCPSPMHIDSAALSSFSFTVSSSSTSSGPPSWSAASRNALDAPSPGMTRLELVSSDPPGRYAPCSGATMKVVATLLVGAMAGAMSTIAMSAVMLGAKRAGVTGELPPERITRRAIDTVSVEPLDDHTEDALAAVAHLGFGAVAGALFCLLTTRTVAARGSNAIAALSGHALRDGHLARELSGLGASSRHYAARIRRPARAGPDDARRPLDLRHGPRDSREAASALALVTKGRAGVRASVEHGSGRGPTDFRPTTHSVEAGLRVCSVAARTARASRRRLLAVGLAALHTRAAGDFGNDPEGKAQDHHECGGRQDEE